MKSLILFSLFSFALLSAEEPTSLQKNVDGFKSEILQETKVLKEEGKEKCETLKEESKVKKNKIKERVKKIKPVACKGKNHLHNYKKEEVKTKSFN
jgi:hypothetical protein